MISTRGWYLTTGSEISQVHSRFCATPGNILNGDGGLVACDHYHRYPEDIRLMQELGVHIYNFSIAWPRTRVGITLNFTQLDPATATLQDQAAARFMDGKFHRWFLDPIFRGTYPADVLAQLGNLAPRTEPGDAEIIARPLDFLGANYYTRYLIQHSNDTVDEFPSVPVEGTEHTAMDWEVYPRGIYNMLVRLHREYAIPQIYVVENGAAFADTVKADSSIDDPRRINYLREHLLQVHQAITEGVPLAGYSAWSLIDNFEWSLGYSMRFGLIYVDYPTQQHTIKASGYWYRDVIATNSVS